MGFRPYAVSLATQLVSSNTMPQPHGKMEQHDGVRAVQKEVFVATDANLV